MDYKIEALKMLEEGRVIFPLKDIDGNITGVAGKLTLKKDLSVPTYVVRGMGFFGNIDTERNEIIITESTIDVLTAQVYKYDNVICCLHAANWKKVFTNDVLVRIAAMNKKIIIFFDNDELGQRNARTLHAKMKEYGIEVYNFTPVFSESDLMDYIKSGRPKESILNML